MTEIDTLHGGGCVTGTTKFTGSADGTDSESVPMIGPTPTAAPSTSRNASRWTHSSRGGPLADLSDGAPTMQQP